MDFDWRPGNVPHGLLVATSHPILSLPPSALFIPSSFLSPLPFSLLSSQQQQQHYSPQSSVTSLLLNRERLNSNGLHRRVLVHPCQLHRHGQPERHAGQWQRQGQVPAGGGAEAAVSGTKKANPAPSPSSRKKSDERVVRVHSIEEFDGALRAAKNRLVVVEFAASHSVNSSRIYPSMVELSRTCGDVDFLLVMGDESEATRELCRREGITQVPHFFYKGAEKVHEEEGIGPDQLAGDVLYYGDNHYGVVQLNSRSDVEALIEEHRGEGGKLVVLDVGLKHCGPCVKVYPTVVKLSRTMADTTVFARMNGDENDSCMEFLRDMEVVEVPTFLFIRDGKIEGRYVGSGKGELVGEILRHQGVRVTY